LALLGDCPHQGDGDFGVVLIAIEAVEAKLEEVAAVIGFRLDAQQ
jgi:hypothetical protein